MPSRPPSYRRTLAVATIVAASILLSACAGTNPAPAPEGAPVVRVPEDAPTISEGLARVAEGGLLLVGSGTYAEQVLIDKPGVTVRGLSRNDTVVDAGGIRPYGIVATADGVSIENLTVTGATFYGVLVTGLHDESGPTAHGGDGYSKLDPARFPPVQRFAIDHVTAHNNGLYGLYAFDAQHGVIRNSYASGSADSGIYVGQCENCDIQVTGNVAENNAVGFENANASDSVSIAGNRFSGNRVGMTLISNYREAFTPQRGNVVAGNLVSSNSSPDSPSQADGGFGIGVGISGGLDNVFDSNRIEGNPRAGILLSSTEDLAARGNLFRGTAWASNGVDIANVSGPRAPARGNCVEGVAPTLLPVDLFSSCAPDVDQPSLSLSGLPAVQVPPGVSFARVAAPPRQPDLPDTGAPARILPALVGPIELAMYPLPAPDLLADRSRG